MDLLEFLFDSSDFVPRWRCGNWPPANRLAAYYFRPGRLVGVRMRRFLACWAFFCIAAATCRIRGSWRCSRRLFWPAVARIFWSTCVFWWPVYRLSAVIKLLTAVVSSATVIALIPIVPKVLRLRAGRIEAEIAARTQAETGLAASQRRLERPDRGGTRPTAISHVNQAD